MSDLAAYRAQLAEVIRRMQLDETPSGNGGSDAISMAREAGYRAGHNDAVRAIAKIVERP